MNDKLVTIANFLEPVQANLAKIKLESEGIQCFLMGENFVATYWLLSTAEQGIKLQVKESDAERALEIIRTKVKDERSGIKDLSSEETDLQCPKCGSEDIEYQKFSKKVVFLSILVFRFPLPFPKNRYICRNCGHVWKGK